MVILKFIIKLFKLKKVEIKLMRLYSIVTIVKGYVAIGRSHKVGSTFWCHLGNQKRTSEVQIKNGYALLMVRSE